MIKAIRAVVCILFAISCAGFGYTFVLEKKNEDKTVPVITVDSDVLEVPLDADDADFLKGVSAYDEKDGDLTDKVIVESVSNFIGDGMCKIIYAVCDSDNHVATAARKISYPDYYAPRFYLNRSLCFSVYENVDAAAALGVKDCIDGDISKNMIITSEDYSGVTTGVFSITAKVSNSKGDSSSVTLPLIIEDRSMSAPVINLKSYLVYTDVNKPIDPESFVSSVTDAQGETDEDLTDSLKIESNADYTKEGVYTVHYYASDSDGVQGHTVLAVVVGK